jgi:outer membrane lipoprotein-sorting protein
MKNLSIVSMLIWAGCLHLIAQTDILPLDRSHPPRGCSLFSPQLNPASHIEDLALLNAYNLQANSIRSLHVEALMRARAGKEYRVGEQQREMPVLIDLVRPDLVRVIGSVPAMSSRGFEMASDGKEFRLLIPEDGKRRFFVGPADAPAQSQNPRENLRPEPISDALLWREGKLFETSAPQVDPAEDRTLKLAIGLTRVGEQTAVVDFDLPRGVVKSVTVYDSAGTLVSRANYSDWAPTEPSPEEHIAGGCFPKQVQFLEPTQDYEIELRVLRVEFNSSLPKSSFHPSPPRGVPVVPLHRRQTKEEP